jgi:ABC-type multidrug transport system fused ATPase/permease subunit
LQVYLSSRFSVGNGEDVKRRLFAKTLELSYADFTRQNAGKLTKSVMGNSQAIATLLNWFLMLVSETFVFLMLYAMVWIVQWKITLVLTVILIAKILVVLRTISGRIRRIGSRNSGINASLYETLQASFGNFKIIKLTGNAPEITGLFGKRTAQTAKNLVASYTLSAMPRLSIETMGFVMLASLVIYVIAKYQDASAIVPIVSMFVLVLYRLLPSSQRILSAFNEIQANLFALQLVYDELSATQPKEGEEAIAFQNEIAAKNVDFAHDRAKPVINDLSLTIKKGQKIGFCGESGGGKSTLVDLLCGVYTPQSGEILVDGKAIAPENIIGWRKKIGYVPQDVYLFDGTVGENVSFGKHYDEAKIETALRQANIYDFLASRGGSRARVGDGGVLLSGGQKQRIAIARALYGDPEILVLDEATSALDQETERAIMGEIYDAAQSKTLLVVAHRLSTLSRCDAVYRIEKGAPTQIDVPKG